MDFFNIIKNVLSKPKDFFKNIKKEKGIKNAFLYFLVFSVITSFLGALYIYGVFSGIKMPQMEQISGSIIWITVVFYIIILVLAILSVFIVSGIIHLFVLLMKGKKGFYQTFKSQVYGNTPQYILSIITSPITIMVYPKFFGAKQIPPEFFIWFVLLIILGLIAFIYEIYLQTIGIKNLHEISTFRAFAAVFLLPLALAAIISIAILAIGFTVGYAAA